MSKQAKYLLENNGKFVIENYHLAKPFSSFFPGIAGLWGIPMWCFYVNRGQAIASFGISGKDKPIMEFFPANKSYQLTSNFGFRTFIKIKSGSKALLWDAFNNYGPAAGYKLKNKMIISPYELSLVEVNQTLGLKTEIDYFTIPSDNFAALARKVTVTNISKTKKDLEIIDGMPRVIPYGLNNWFLKHMSRTIEAWIDVDNLKNKAPFMRLRVDAADRSEVVHIKEGNFGICFDKKGMIKPIVDPAAVFGHMDDFSFPAVFLQGKKFSYPQQQMTKNKIPCFLNSCPQTLKAKESYAIFSLVGYMDSLEKLNQNLKRITKEKYFLAKRNENKALIEDIQSYSFTRSSTFGFDAYCGQNFLDNVLRGGLPITIDTGEKQVNLNVYSRKHGDLERDYNNFIVEAGYFSQGNGNFRDVNQNRRNDIWFNPKIKEESVVGFFNLLQTDGYNPLVIKPERFIYKGNIELVGGFLKQEDLNSVLRLLKRAFTPGELLANLEKNKISLKCSKEDFIKKILSYSSKALVAEHGEGFWTDHWHYCLDLLESYLKVYPENLKNLLFEQDIFTFFDNQFVVLPRSKRYVLHENKVRQFEGVVNHHKKSELINSRKEFKHLSRCDHGRSEIYRTTLISKMLTVIANKFATLDPNGVGIEMEADKPNWCDALNGLPGLFGSSICETFELKRWILFVLKALEKGELKSDCAIRLSHETHDLLLSLEKSLNKEQDGLHYWNEAQAAKEIYRENTLFGFEGAETCISLEELVRVLKLFLKKIDIGIEKAYDSKANLYHSYFINEMVAFEKEDKHAKPLKFNQTPLPFYLEGIVHYLRVADDEARAKEVVKGVRASELFDKKLKMFKINASLEEMPEEIGRCRIFTPGWLENESIWMHMEYKYLLELIKNGFYQEFFDNLKNCLPPFQDAKQYGRSILENSSFICSSAFPQEQFHGNGFVARLSGSTAEFVNIWLMMCVGNKPFYIDQNGSLCLRFKPVLPGWLFNKTSNKDFPKNTFAFKFLNKTLVVYHNPKLADTFGEKQVEVKEVHISIKGREPVIINSALIEAPFSYQIRNCEVERIDCFLS